MPVRLKDVMAAEQALDEAESELRAATQPTNWAAHESLDRRGRRHLNISDVDLQRQELARDRVQRADAHLRALQKAFASGSEIASQTLPTIQLEGQ